MRATAKDIGCTMSEQSPADRERPRNAALVCLGPIGIDYNPTEEERKVFRQCNQESFWYRSLPISATSMAFTQFLISRGALTSSGRFGSLPKVVFAGVCGYLGGKISYMKTCQEKFMSLENSPLGEALRQKQQHQPPKFPSEQPGLSDPNKADFEPVFQLDDQRDQSASYASDFTYTNPMHTTNHSGTQITESSYIEDDAQKKHVLYKDLQSKNRENYEVTMTQKPDALPKSSADSTPTKRGKKNIYGDTWEE
ncbi:OCIA domain-containing protein 1-like isoform X2 [Pimephales promelas]|uniref:OCIA domain-containing protein 1-like isoform X2 n=1 Tax=Pimephales promelas TaxID=90988 RepID=UPI00195574C0|nr:OCIA domain-containing protein 1-like isoform X2 [Pimephales promelas]